MVVVHLSFLGPLDACFHIRWVHMVLRHGPVAVLSSSPPHKASCACPIFLTGLGLVLDSKFIYMVGYEFPTMGCSQPDYLTALLCPYKTPPSPLSSSLWLVLSLFSSLFSLSMTNRLSLLTSPIYSLRLVECS